MKNDKSPDRINISKEALKLIGNIDESKYMDLDNSSTNRMSLFLFAMALGISVDTRTKLPSISGLVLEQNIKEEDKSLLYAHFIAKIENDDIDSVSEKKLVFEIAQEYANTGFQIIEDKIRTVKSENYPWELFQELDQKYEEYFEGSC